MYKIELFKDNLSCCLFPCKLPRHLKLALFMVRFPRFLVCFQTKLELAGLGGAGFVLASWWEVPPVRAGLAGLNGFTLV